MSVAAAAATIALAGCGGNSGDKATSTSKATGGPGSTAASTTDETAGRPLDASGPEATVREMTRLLGSGVVPGAALLYDQRLSKAVGRDIFIAAIRQVAGAYAQSKVQITGKRRTSAGTILLVKRLAGKNPPVAASYIVRRAGDSWKIVYDSFLSDSVLAVATQRRQREIDPKAARPGPRAIASGTALRLRFDSVAGTAVPKPA
jgi:hypothetical protein